MGGVGAKLHTKTICLRERGMTRRLSAGEKGIETPNASSATRSCRKFFGGLVELRESESEDDVASRL